MDSLPVGLYFLEIRMRALARITHPSEIMEAHERIKITGRSKYVDKCEGIWTAGKSICNVLWISQNICRIEMCDKNNLKGMRDKWS